MGTINVLDNLVKTQGKLIKSTKKFKPLKIKKIRYDSYKRLLRKQNKAKTFNVRFNKNYSNISNVYHARSKFLEEHVKSAPQCYDCCFEVSDDDESDAELERQLDPKNLIGFDFRSYQRQDCQIEW